MTFSDDLLSAATWDFALMANGRAGYRFSQGNQSD